MISSDCPGDKACIGNKCVNPCTQNVCGIKATCKAINHSPLCSCPPPLIGNPFDECIIQIGNYMIFIFVILVFNFLRIFMLSLFPCNLNFFYINLLYLFQKLILVVHLHALIMANVKFEMASQYAYIQNVLLILIVHEIRLVSTRNVKILASVLVVSIHYVKQ